MRRLPVEREVCRRLADCHLGRFLVLVRAGRLRELHEPTSPVRARRHRLRCSLRRFVIALVAADHTARATLEVCEQPAAPSRLDPGRRQRAMDRTYFGAAPDLGSTSTNVGCGMAGGLSWRG